MSTAAAATTSTTDAIKVDEDKDGDQKTKKFFINYKEFNVDRRYHPVAVLGEGSYGTVCLCKDAKNDKKKVAIKKCSFTEKFRAQVLRTLREIYILRNMDHPNVLKLVDLMPPLKLDDPDCVYVVMDSMDTNLRRIIRSRQPLENIDIQILTFQLLKGLKYMHDLGVIHRDIKPSNLLVNADLHLKICDFGLSRGTKETSKDSSEAMTEYVVTRHYRAPEVMTNPTKYDTKIDVWGAGCILGELLGREVMFQGSDYLSQLRLIIEAVGAPGKDDLEQVHPNARSFIQEIAAMLSDQKRPNWPKKFPKADPKALDLLDKMLQFNPKKRITIGEALKHSWFQSMYKHEYFRELRVLSIDKKPTSQLDFAWEKPKMSREDLLSCLYTEVGKFRPHVLTAASLTTSTAPSTSSTSSTSTTSTASASTTTTAAAATTSTSGSSTSASVATLSSSMSGLAVSTAAATS